MRRFFVLIPLLLSSLALGFAQVTPASVFIDSSPLGARIVIDGQLTDDRTPALVRGLAPGKHRLSLWKTGYIAASQDFSVVAGKVPTVRVSLPPEAVTLAFPIHDQVLSPQGPLSTQARQFQYPTGAYFLSGGDEAARLYPIFEDNGEEESAIWALLFDAGAFIASGAVDYYQYTQGGPPNVSLFTIASGLVTVGEAIWYSALQGKKARFYQQFTPSFQPTSGRLELAGPLFREGEERLSEGDLPGAEATFLRLVRDHPDSRWVPGAWFRLAKIHLVTGRRDLALGEYRLVAEAFPQPDYHDRARQALADLSEARGDPEAALYHLERMVLNDGFFDPAAVEAQKGRLARQTKTLTPPLDEVSTPRQGYYRAMGLFAEGHEFTAAEWTKLEELGNRLSEGGEPTFAADLVILRGAQSAAAKAAENGNLQEWTTVERARQDRESWRGIRDATLPVYRFAAGTTLMAALLSDRTNASAAFWITSGALGVTGVSLFPLLWAEPRQ